jgi:hypothetical protein
MSKKSGIEISFQEKFKDRMENMGKDGVIGIIKNTENPINKVEIDKMKNWNNLYNEGKILYNVFIFELSNNSEKKR